MIIKVLKRVISDEERLVGAHETTLGIDEEEDGATEAASF